MDLPEIYVLLILVLNTLLALIVCIVGCFLPKGRRITTLQYGLILLFCPVVGLIFLLVCAIFSRLTEETPVDMSDISFDKTREKQHLMPDSESERNLTSIDDAIAFTDTAELRRLLIEVLKRNRRETLTSVALALDSEDTEVSHYAASAVQDALSEFRQTSQRLQSALMHSPEDAELNLKAFDYLVAGLSLKIMTPIEQRSYIYVTNDVAQVLFDHNVWYMDAEHYLTLVKMLLSIQDYDLAQTWCERAALYRPDKLETYKAQMRCCYEMGKREAFLGLIQQFKTTDIKADEEMLELIRMFQPAPTAAPVRKDAAPC